MLRDKRKKEIFNEVDQRIAKGENLRSVYEIYVKEFSDREPLVNKLLSNPEPTMLKKTRWQNGILIAINFYFGILKLIEAVPLMYSIHPLATPIALIVPIFNIWFVYALSKNLYIGYDLLAIYSVLGLMKLFPEDYSYIQTTAHAIDLLISSLLLVITLILAINLRKRLFPYKPYWGFKKDASGNYIIPEKAL